MADTLNYWNNIYSKENFFGTGPTKLAKYGNHIIKKHKINNILEVGCGQGRDSIYFSQLKYNVHAFDISPNAIEFVKKIKESMNLRSLNLFVHDMKKPFNFTSENFDFIYSNLALQFFNIKNLEIIFKNIARIMKKDALFLFSTKKEGDKYYQFGNKISEFAFEYKGITRYFYDSDILKKALFNEFEMLEVDYDEHKNPDSTVSVWWKILAKKS